MKYFSAFILAFVSYYSCFSQSDSIEIDLQLNNKNVTSDSSVICFKYYIGDNVLLEYLKPENEFILLKENLYRHADSTFVCMIYGSNSIGWLQINVAKIRNSGYLKLGTQTFEEESTAPKSIRGKAYAMDYWTSEKEYDIKFSKVYYTSKSLMMNSVQVAQVFEIYFR